ncbi:glycoside hydrolase family 3 C-terminal domain-containing protein [Terrabacter sp. GCM10028922]|uniref:glycoside hydrolase family 3 C-terminal domain-containing protein n=1 Tax=Terrabacter sp. GCM10028922 TaxID=3273428 RepID=UPI003619BCE8
MTRATMTLDVDRLLAELTLEEKAALTSGSSFWYTRAVERLGIPKIMVSDGPHGLRAQPGVGDHVGLGGSLPATCFPTASAIASSWNPELLGRVGAALAAEARACNLSVILGPGVNMKRSPLCGRNFEYFSEDPYLAGELGVGIVDGIQSNGVGVCVKHFAANNQEDDRLRVDAQVDERSLREIYLPAFERIVTSCRPWTVMCSYNKINGVSASENTWLLTTVLRDEWGFDGLVVSDWGAVYHRVPALLAGLDLEMPPSLPRSPDRVAAAVAAREVPEDVLDRRVRAVLELVSKGSAVLDLDEDFDVDAHHALAREAAAESIVLLKNEDDLLPLSRGSRVGVIGEFARTPRFQGAGSSQVNPTKVDVPLEELRTMLDVAGFAPAYGIGDTSQDDRLRDEAVALARDCDVVVMFLGLPGADESEGFDRTHLNLPSAQLEALAAVSESNPNVVGVLVNGSTVVLDQVVPRVSALVEAWLGGQAAAGGMADVLTGVVNPSGRLAESIPHRLEDSSSFLNFPGDSQVVRYGEGIFIGYRGYDQSRLEVAFPFGFGLSYTTFDLADLTVSTSGSVADDSFVARAEVTVTNTGTRAGAEVVQVYVRDVVSSVSRPVRELKGFTKVWLEAGESKRVQVVLDQRAFAFWSIQLRRWVVEAGEFAVEVGRHSRDLALSEVIIVAAPSIAPPLTRDSTLHEWLADPVARHLIRQLVEEGGPDPAADEELVKVIGTMPMSTIASFEGPNFVDHDTLDRLVMAWNERAEAT